MIISILITFMVVLLAIPVCVVFLQTLLASLLKPKQPNLRYKAKPSIGVLIPAHNESINILPTLQNIIPQLSLGDRLVVVADNCSDDTASVASSVGAIVIERHNLTHRGKGFALDFGLRYFAEAPPDIIVIMDADCLFAGTDLQKLSMISYEIGRPVQALYLMKNPIENATSLKAKIAEFAWLFKNRVRPFGNSIVGFPCQLMGSGMAFPWLLIKNSDLANGNIVEDMKLGIELAKKGYAPFYFDEIEVISYFPTLEKSQRSQSRRWEHGHLSMLMSETFPLLISGFVRRDANMVAMAFDLLVPPLSLLVLLVLVSCVLASIGEYYFHIKYVFPFSLLVIGLLIFSILLAWFNWARHIIAFKQLLFIPLYIIKKFPNYLSFIFKKQKSWIRTDRN